MAPEGSALGLFIYQIVAGKQVEKVILGQYKGLTYNELVSISEAFDVSINFLLTGDEMFSSLHQLKKKDAKIIMDEIEKLRPEIEC